MLSKHRLSGAMSNFTGVVVYRSWYPPKTNMTIKHPPFEDVFPIENGDFPACHSLVFRGVGLPLLIPWRGFFGIDSSINSKHQQITIFLGGLSGLGTWSNLNFVDRLLLLILLLLSLLYIYICLFLQQMIPYVFEHLLKTQNFHYKFRKKEKLNQDGAGWVWRLTRRDVFFPVMRVAALWRFILCIVYWLVERINTDSFKGLWFMIEIRICTTSHKKLPCTMLFGLNYHCFSSCPWPIRCPRNIGGKHSNTHFVVLRHPMSSKFTSCVITRSIFGRSIVQCPLTSHKVENFGILR